MSCMAVLFIAIVSMGFASCGDDDNNDLLDNTTTSSAPVKSCPDANHPHMIDLGLPSGTLWACCNVGANTPEDYGDYYTFGAAQDYNLPSYDQISEFLENTTSVWTTQNGVNGRKFTSKINGGMVFLPAGGQLVYDLYDDRGGDKFENLGERGHYWSSTLAEGNNAYYLGFTTDYAKFSRSRSDYRSNGKSVRIVR